MLSGKWQNLCRRFICVLQFDFVASIGANPVPNYAHDFHPAKAIYANDR